MTTHRILVTGASGFLGRAVVDDLKRRGLNVTGAVRSTKDALQNSVVLGDISHSMDRTDDLRPFDVAIHCAARAHILKETADDPLAHFRSVNTEGALELARQCATAGVRRFIFLSSIGVNGAQTYGLPFRHDDPPNPHSPYAVSKWEAEQGLAQISKQTDMDVVIIRPPLIIGRDPKGNLATLKKAIARGLPLPLGLATKNRRDFVSLETLCSLIYTAIDHPKAAGQTFLVSDGQAISTRTLLEHLAADQCRSANFVPIPPTALSWPLRLVGKGGLASQLFGDLEVDIGHTCRTLDWSPVKPC